VAVCKYAQLITGFPGIDTAAPSRQHAEDLGYQVGDRTIRRHRAEQCVCYATDATDTPAAGESEQHNPDGSASYTRFSDKPWGYEDYRRFIASKGQDPDKVTFTWGWTSNPAGGTWNKLNNVRPILSTEADEDVDLPALYAAARHATPKPTPATFMRATVIVWADPQIGKTGSRGGTPELIERSTLIRGKLNALLGERAPARILLADAGDGIEGFESGGNPMFTNDLSLSGQLDTYGTELFEYINLAHGHAPVTVAGIPSNHSAWRNGKQNLGRPSDDLGLFMHRQVQRVTDASGMDVTWVRPAEYDESVSVDFYGTTVGVVHGNQFGPGQAVTWWTKQAFGAQAAARADILVHGHYHAFSASVAGRNPATGRQRYCLGAPTLDNGSDWFRQVAGKDSDPGLMVFDITENGFDLSSLTILTA
jgi:hypothetical protein